MLSISERLDDLEQRVGALETMWEAGHVPCCDALLEDVRSVGETLVAIQAAWEAVGDTGARLAGVTAKHPPEQLAPAFGP